MNRKVRKGRGATSTIRREGSLRKRKNSAPMGRWLKHVFLVVMTTGVIYGLAVSGIELNRYLDSRKVSLVRVEGQLINLKEDEVRTAVAGVMHESLLRIDLDQIKHNLESLPWVRKANVGREWPDTLIIDVTEQQAIARWRRRQLLNQDGQVFSPDNIGMLVSLPYLEGPQGTEFEVMQQYQKFSQLLYPQGLKVSALHMNERGAWTITLDNNTTVKVGNESVMSRMRRFVTFIDMDATGGLNNIETIDLRYSNGIAVESRQVPEESVVSL